MKKQYFLFFALIFSACLPPSGDTPQVTVTSAPTECCAKVTVTSTPIPTPTLHPAFIEIQEKIKSSGTRFTLQADGTVHAGSETIPGLTVAPDGIMTLTVNGETVTLDPADVDFDDETGITIDGYKWDATANGGAGAWVEAMSPAESQLHVDMEKWGIDLDGKDAENYSATISGEDVTVVDQESGEIIYKNGSWEPLFLGRMIRESGSCKVTSWTGNQIGPSEARGSGSFLKQYVQPLGDYYGMLLKNNTIEGTGRTAGNYYMGDKCWGIIFHVQDVQPVAWYFWKDQNGRPKYEKVFLGE